MTLFLAPEISALSAFTTVTRFPRRISFATFEQSLPAIWSVASILTTPPRRLASTIGTGGGAFVWGFFSLFSSTPLCSRTASLVSFFFFSSSPLLLLSYPFPVIQVVSPSLYDDEVHSTSRTPL